MKRILAADIGGTHSRFGYFRADEKGKLSLVETQWIDTANASSFAHLMDLLQKTPFSLSPEQSDIEKGVFCSRSIRWAKEEALAVSIH